MKKAFFNFVPYLKAICIIVFMSFYLQSSAAVTSIVTLEWDASIDAAYLQSYKIYFSTQSFAPNAPTVADSAVNYSYNGGTTWELPVDGVVPSPITIPSSKIKITLKFSDSNTHYFALTAVDTRGLESEFSGEVYSNPSPQITVLTINGASGTDPVYTNTSVKVGIYAYDDVSVNQYLILDSLHPDITNPGSSIYNYMPFTTFAQTQDLTAPSQRLSFNFDLSRVADGEREIQVKVKDNAGAESFTSYKFNVFLDRVSPSPPAGLDLATADDTGISSSDNITNKTTVTINGTGEDYATVQLYDDGIAIGATATVAGGAFSRSITLPEGVHSITAKQTDRAGNISDISAALQITVDTTLPKVLSAGLVDQNTLDVSFSETINDGATKARYNIPGLAISSASWSVGNTYRLAISTATPGATYTTTVNTMTDVAGNALNPAFTTATFTVFRITVDAPTAAPFREAGSVNLITSGSAPRTATFSGTAGTAGKYRWTLSGAGVGTISSTTADTITYTAPAGISGTTQRDTLTLRDADNPGLQNSIDINIYNPLAVTRPAGYVAGTFSTWPLLAAGTSSVTAAGGLPGNFNWSIIEERTGLTRVGPAAGSETYPVYIDTLFNAWGAGVYTIRAEQAGLDASDMKIRIPLRIAPMTGVYNDTDPDQNFTVTGHSASSPNLQWTVTDEAGTELADRTFVSFLSETTARPGVNAFNFNPISQQKTFRVQAQSGDAALVDAGLHIVKTDYQIIKPVRDFPVQVNNSTTGAGIAGAVVTATHNAAKTGTTDGTGRAIITSMENTGITYTFSVAAAGHGPITFTSNDLSQLKTVTMVAIAVDSLGTISGTVSLSGVPNSGIPVYLKSSNAAEPRPQVLTGSNGTYSLTFDKTVESAPYTVVATKTGFVTSIDDNTGVASATLGQTNANINMPPATRITITNDGGSPTLTYSITAVPAFNNTAGEIQIFAGTEAVGNNLAAGATFAGGTGTYTYSVSTPAALQAASIFVRADTSTAGRNASSGYYATATNIFVSPAPNAAPIVLVTETQTVSPNTVVTATAASAAQPDQASQAGSVTVTPGGVDTLESVALGISNAPPVTVTTGSSLIYVTSLAYTAGGEAVPDNLINKIYFTISFDPTRVPAGSLESGAMAILLAPDMAAMAAGTVTSVPTSQIMSVNYAIGEVTFWVNSLPVVGVGAGSVTGASGGGDSGGGGCFIATAAFGSYMEKHVRILSEFRDRYLLTTRTGSRFVEFYYRHSPPIADYLRQHSVARAAVRYALLPVTGIVYLAMKVNAAIFLIALIFMLVGIALVVKRRTSS